MEKKKYVKPVLASEEFVPQEYIAACFVDAYSYRGAGIIGKDVKDERIPVKGGGYETFTHQQLGTVNKPCNIKNFNIDDLYEAQLAYGVNNNRTINGITYVSFQNEEVFDGLTDLDPAYPERGEAIKQVGCFFVKLPAGSVNKNNS